MKSVLSVDIRDSDLRKPATPRLAFPTKVITGKFRGGDFVLEDRQGRITGVEVKASASVCAGDFKGLRHMKETEPAAFQRGVVLYGGREVTPFAADLFAVPLSMWWAPLQQL